MKFNLFKKKEKKHHNGQAIISPPSDSYTNLPEIYRGMQIHESESDRFGAFDEESFKGENYEPSVTKRKKRKPIAPPKTPSSFLVGIFCGALSVLIISCGITFLSLFSKFGGIYTSVTVPDFTTLTEAEAISLIKNHYNCFDYSIEYKENPNLALGAIISQIPKPKTARKLYGINGRITIKLTVNKLSESITLPDIIGQNARDVVLELKNAGINVELIEKYSNDVPIGKIISSSHAVGATLPKNTTVYVTASLGKKISYVSVPTLVGMSESSAISTLSKAGLRLGNVVYKSSEMPLGTVIEQSVNGKSSLREGSRVDLVVSG